MGLTGHNEKKQYLHYGNFRRKREREETESIFKAIMAEDFPKLGREMDIQSHKAQRTPL